MNIHGFLIVQRLIELLAFYLILANINGMDLKESCIRLVKTKQRTLYDNVIVLIGYPLLISFVIEFLRGHGWGTEVFLIDQLFRPLVAHLLLRRVFDIKKALLAYLFTMFVGFIIAIPAYVFDLHGVFVYLWILSMIAFMSHHNYFEKLYGRLEKKVWLLKGAFALSAILYVMPFFVSHFPLIAFPILASVLFLAVIVHVKIETARIVEQIKTASSHELHQVLEELASDRRQSDPYRSYTIKHYNTMDIGPALSRKLDFNKRQRLIKDYELVLEKRQIKINVIL